MRAFFPGLCLLITACVSASGVRLGESRHPPRPPEYDLAVYDHTEDLPRPYSKVARIVGEGSDSATFAAVVDAMVEEARAFGADALVLTGTDATLHSDGDCVDCDHRVHGLAVRWRQG